MEATTTTWTSVVEALASHGRRVTVAESFTGGRLLAAITQVPGASRVLAGGIVAYEDSVKRRDLGVKAGTLARHGAVSEPVALEMAAGALNRFPASYALATTGIAGPTGATDAKPIGLSVVAVAAIGSAKANTQRHTGSRTVVQDAAVEQALRLLEERLVEDGIL